MVGAINGSLASGSLLGLVRALAYSAFPDARPVGIAIVGLTLLLANAADFEGRPDPACWLGIERAVLVRGDLEVVSQQLSAVRALC